MAVQLLHAGILWLRLKSGYAIMRNGSYDLYAPVRFSDDASKDRNLTKLAFLIGINAQSPNKACAALRSNIVKDRSKFPYLGESLNNRVMQGIFDNIYAAHPALTGYLGTGIGTRLQFLDSLIAERILYRFTFELGVPCLSIHDSFIVPSPHSDHLIDVMYESFMEVIKTLNPRNEYNYRKSDLISAEITLGTNIPLVAEMADAEYERVLKEHEFHWEDLWTAFIGGYGEENMTRPIERRICTWRIEGNMLPYDSIS